MATGLEIQRMLPRSGRGLRRALVWGWPTPIAFTARTELPLMPRRPVYGSELHRHLHAPPIRKGRVAGRRSASQSAPRLGGGDGRAVAGRGDGERAGGA